MMSDTPAAEELLPAKKVGNRRREGYELTRQRNMMPVILGAGAAALVLHLFVYFWAPEVLHIDFRSLLNPPKAEDEEMRVIVREQPEEEIKEAEQQELPDTPPEPEEIAYEPQEIDILDAQMEELTLAPGKTELAVPEPVIVKDDAESTISDMAPTQLDFAALEADAVPPEALAVAEPTPVSNNDVVVAAEAQPEELKEADALLDSELRRSAADKNSALPADTRSLAELMGVENLGAKSGVARLGADLLFGFNECQLRTSARLTMLQLAALIQKNPNTWFLIEGHTDSLGSPEYNALLGLQRAAAVRAWLVSNAVPVEHVYIRSCGSGSPLVATDGDKEQQAMNRRVEIHMRKQGEEVPAGALDHKQAVDIKTPVTAQIAAGVKVKETAAFRVPESKSPDKSTPKTDKQATGSGTAKPAATKPAAPKKPAATGTKKPTSVTKTVNKVIKKGNNVNAKKKR